MHEIYLRLANYRADSPEMQLIQRSLEFDDHKRARLKTPKKIPKYGWVLLDHIEAEPCPYGNPEKHRYLYLKDDPLIETGKLRFLVRMLTPRPGDQEARQKNRVEYTKTVYRLKRTAKARDALREFFMGNLDFLASDYCAGQEATQGDKLLSDLAIISMAVDEKLSNGVLHKPPDYFQSLFRAIKDIETCMRKAAKRSRKKKNWTQLSEAPSVTGVSGYNSQKDLTVCGLYRGMTIRTSEPILEDKDGSGQRKNILGV